MAAGHPPAPTVPAGYRQLEETEDDMVRRKGCASVVGAAASCVAVLLALGPGAAPLQGQAAFGGQVVAGTEQDFGVGGRVAFGLSELAPELEGAAEFNLFFPDGPTDFWEINGNILYAFPLRNTRSVLPYAGGGLNIARIDFDSPGDEDEFRDENTEVGLNLLGGVRFPSRTVAPYVEARGVISDADQLVFTFGVLFGDVR